MHVHAAGERHAHGHGHSHAHAHDAASMSRGLLVGAMASTLALIALEIAGGTFGHSIALISDAVHNLADVPMLFISWLAARLAERPADAHRTFGYRRAGVLGAFTNGILLVLVAAGLLYEVYQRFLHPEIVGAGWMIAISLVALSVNGGITLALVRGRSDLNLRSIYIHNLGDSLSNIGVLIGAVILHYTGAAWIDPAIAAVIGLLVLWSTIGILRESGNILLEGLPAGLEVEKVARSILKVPGVREVHDIHIWTLGNDHHALSCHVRVPDMHMDESEKIVTEICKQLDSEFHISHITVQLERAGLPADAGYFMPEPFQNAK
jgi:cobalt-zinc-cadmium efflux system protein